MTKGRSLISIGVAKWQALDTSGSRSRPCYEVRHSKSNLKKLEFRGRDWRPPGLMSIAGCHRRRGQIETILKSGGVWVFGSRSKRNSLEACQ
jgi:hypothetical protein